jgi:superfamily I DNA/RNA helicase
MVADPQTEAKQALDRILASKSRKKLVVAGPGAGKTYLFRKLLEIAEGEPNQRLVLTFINALKNDLVRSLGEQSDVFTLHGYCQHLLRRYSNLRNGLSATFRCYPGLTGLIRTDWEWLRGSGAPHFVKLMRDLECTADQHDFYRERANYYDAVDFDDSVYRTYAELAADPRALPDYSLVLIDEFQDFNKMEGSVIDLLAERNPIVLAGDDDQALYSKLRGASWDHIRAHYAAGHYEVFELPFCMRCPEVIVGAVSDVIAKAGQCGNLIGRIEKAYRYFEPIKGDDSLRFPHIGFVETTVQRANANYFGRYIEKCIRAIPQADRDAAAENHEPVALIIGSNPYRRQVQEYLAEVGIIVLQKDVDLSEREVALQLLSQNPGSNLGRRIILSCGNLARAREIVRRAADDRVPLVTLMSDRDRQAVLDEASAWVAQHGIVEVDPDRAEETPSVAVTSYEGSKGRSAQYVFLIGVHSGEIPADATQIKDLEICRFLVGLTRTKKKCDVLVARNAMGQFKQRSEFLRWIAANRFQTMLVNAAYFA